MSHLTDSPAWRALVAHQRELADVHMRTLFAHDPDRGARLRVQWGALLLDFAKNRVTDETMTLLYQLADARELRARIDGLFAGEHINHTEDRAVMHMALRNPVDQPAFVDGEDVMPAVRAELDHMARLSGRVRDGSWRGATGERITDVVNIGIGGSDLGPVMVCEALKPYQRPDLRVHFVSNVDGAHLGATIAHLDPATTLFIVASKTFTTRETLTNAHSARRWLLRGLSQHPAQLTVEAADATLVARHFVALSTNAAGVAAFGIDPANMLRFWDWVGGRYSLWSSIGLSIAIAVGMPQFEQLLAGGHDADTRFRSLPWHQNLPVILAMLGVWYHNFFHAESHAILPYDQSLHRFPAYFQQGVMESNGKRVDHDGEPITDYSTGPVVWGEPGTNGQHAFFQLLHQGTHLVPTDFLAPVESHYGEPDVGADHHAILLANCLAQTEALMRGKTSAEAQAELLASGLSATDVAALLPHKVFPGNRPSNTLLFPKLTPFELGRLIAVYEHKIFVQGSIWGVNSFDQWGVELGKQLANAILPEIQGDEVVSVMHDSSTAGLIAWIRGQRR